MSDRAFLDTNGLIHYNSSLMKSLNPDCEFKKGLVSKSDLPCYTSNSKEEYSKTTAVFYDIESTNSRDFTFLKDNYEGNKENYTVIFDGIIYEGLYVRHAEYGQYANRWLLGSTDPNDSDSYLFAFEYYDNGSTSYSAFYTEDENVYDWDDRTDEKRGEVLHNVKIYLSDPQNEYVHKLDSKYIKTSEGISGSDAGITTGSQVYTYVNNQIAVMQNVVDTIESTLATI